MENIIGKAKSYLEEKGIDTSNMTIEEIINKYNELIAEEEIVEDVEDKDQIEAFIEENQETIDTLNEEQKAMFDKLIVIARD